MNTRTALPAHSARRRLLSVLALAASLAMLSNTPAWAQAYPAKPIRMVVGYAPGGSVDMAARIAADVIAAQLGATVVVDNQSGAAGTVAAQRLVTSPADGYTLLTGSSNEMAATGQVNPAQKYDPLKDMTPIGLIATAPVLLVASPRTNVKSLAEFIELTRRNPGKFSYGSSGVGSTLHFAGELIKQRAGIFMTHIPYRSTSSLTTDLVGGTLDFAMISPTAAVPFIKGGRIVPLGVTSATRMASLPNVPALGENPQLKGYELSGWFALAGPANLPPEVTQRLRTALATGLKDPAIRKRLEAGGSVPATGNEDLAKIMRDDVAKFAGLVKFANMKD